MVAHSIVRACNIEGSLLEYACVVLVECMDMGMYGYGYVCIYVCMYGGFISIIILHITFDACFQD